MKGILVFSSKRFEFPVKLWLLTVMAAVTIDAVHFDCTFSARGLALLGSAYQCQAKVVLSGSTVLESVTGVHLPENTNDDVEYLFLHTQSLTVFPQGIVNFFKNLRALDFWYTHILVISAGDLQPFSRLEHFTLCCSNLTSVDGDLFSSTPQLKVVNLQLNQIQHIGLDFVTNLNSLQHLYLGGNICVNSLATTRAAIIELAAQLPALCPPLDEPTTTIVTITETPTEPCPCDEKVEENRRKIQQQEENLQEQELIIEQLQQSNDQQVQTIGKLLELNAALEQRLLDVEMTLREISSVPCSH